MSNDCPRCGHKIPNDESPGAYPGALSRTDDETEICSACGTHEAFEAMIDGVSPQLFWPVTYNREFALSATRPHPQNQDGVVHLAYFNFEHDVSFVWNGVYPYISVCPNGYGEPEADRIPLDLESIDHRNKGWGSLTSLYDLQAHMRMVCERYLANKE